MGSNPLLRQEQMPTLAKADQVLAETIANAMRQQDANDMLYQVSASWDYDPAPGLERIRAPLFAVNFADDLINPPELGILERGVKRVKRGTAVVDTREPADSRPWHAHHRGGLEATPDQAAGRNRSIELARFDQRSKRTVRIVKSWPRLGVRTPPFDQCRADSSKIAGKLRRLKSQAELRGKVPVRRAQHVLLGAVRQRRIQKSRAMDLARRSVKRRDSDAPQ